VKDGIGREKAGQFGLGFRRPTSFTCRESPKEGMLWIFSLRPDSNPRSWVPEASMLTTRPPKPLKKTILLRMEMHFFPHILQFSSHLVNTEKYRSGYEFVKMGALKAILYLWAWKIDFPSLPPHLFSDLGKVLCR
jgi:hypothetical protein